MHYLRQSTATTTWFGPFVEASDGYSYKATTITLVTTGAVVQILKSNNSITGLAAQPSLVSPGWMLLPIAATDVDQLGPLKYMIGNATSNLPVWADFTVLPANVYDSYILGTDFLQVDVMQVTGAAPSSAAIGSVANLTTGVAVTSIAAGVGVNVTSIAGVAPSTALGAFPLDYVMSTPGVQSLTLKDYHRAAFAALAGRVSGATGAAMSFFDPTSVAARIVGAVDGSGNRTGVTWVTGP